MGETRFFFEKMKKNRVEIDISLLSGAERVEGRLELERRQYIGNSLTKAVLGWKFEGILGLN